jgi:hypothetical protein
MINTQLHLFFYLIFKWVHFYKCSFIIYIIFSYYPMSRWWYVFKKILSHCDKKGHDTIKQLITMEKPAWACISPNPSEMPCATPFLSNNFIHWSIYSYKPYLGHKCLLYPGLDGLWRRWGLVQPKWASEVLKNTKPNMTQFHGGFY